MIPKKGFEPGFENPITGTPVTIVMKVPISDPDSPTYVPPPAGEFPPTPVITINDVDTTSFNPLTQVLVAVLLLTYFNQIMRFIKSILGIHLP